MAKRSYTFYCDPGHGWLKVSYKEIKRLGIQNDITGHSYMRYNGESWDCYLEEDCDTPRFIEAKKALGEEVKPSYRYSKKSSKVRSYYSYDLRYLF